MGAGTPWQVLVHGRLSGSWQDGVQPFHSAGVQVCQAPQDPHVCAIDSAQMPGPRLPQPTSPRLLLQGTLVRVLEGGLYSSSWHCRIKFKFNKQMVSFFLFNWNP